MRLLLLLVLAAALAGCQKPNPVLKSGIWRGVIETQGQQLPFNFEIEPTEKDSAGYTIYLKNAGEKITLDEIRFYGDTVSIELHIFDAELRARINSGEMTGYYIRKFEKNYRIPFHATWGEDFRFTKTNTNPTVDFTGKYGVKFFHGKDTAVSVGIFKQQGNRVEGTFLNPSGDYRYLDGNVIDNKMWLSTFDGYHVYLFSATKQGESTLTGDFWSGKTRRDTWVGTHDENAALPSAESLTYLKKGFEKLDFHFPDLQGNMRSPSDAQYKDKVLILQIFGTWCPNCMDETKFLAPWYRKNKDRGVEILGLAYETKDDFQYAAGRVSKMKKKLDVDYDFVIAGTNDNAKASKTLPALNRVMAFPTTIFIGKDGKVRHIQTGFAGPGTGVYYDQFMQHFNETVNELLSEKLTSSSSRP